MDSPRSERGLYVSSIGNRLALQIPESKQVMWKSENLQQWRNLRPAD